MANFNLENASLAPTEISVSTMYHLLSLYPSVNREVYRAKCLQKKRRQPKNKSATTDPFETGIDDEEARLIEHEVAAFIELDKWRYECMPSVLSERAGLAAKDHQQMDQPRKKAKATSKGFGLNMEKEDLVKLMDWKL